MNRFMCVLSVGIIAGSLFLSACTTNLGPETLPSTTPATEATVETEPTEETIPEVPEHTEPYSQAIITGSIVNSYGALSVSGNDINNSEGLKVVLKGMSTYGIQECGDFFTPEVVKTLAEDWGIDVLRIAITGDANSDGYMKEPERYFDNICKICDMCVAQGIYVIVDWNILYSDSYDENADAAVDFFSRLSVIYSDTENVIYEINNDPVKRNSEVTSADELEYHIKPFMTRVIDSIRANDPDNIIIVGAPNNGLDINVASKSQLEYGNIAYGCRFFSGPHTEDERNVVAEALGDGVCVFVTQWALTNEFGVGGIHLEESNKWIEFINEKGLSWCNYAIGSTSTDDTNALNLDDPRYTDEQKNSAHWPLGLISESGAFAREQFFMVESADETEETEAEEE